MLRRKKKMLRSKFQNVAQQKKNAAQHFLHRQKQVLKTGINKK
jgi:hypothetical protein